MPLWYVKPVTLADIPEGAKVVLPISLSNPVYKDPERLKVLIGHYSQYQLTVLLADGLNRFNVGDEEAQKEGDDYIETYEEILSKVTYVRWNDWIAERKGKVNECRAFIEEACGQDSPLHKKCLKTINSLKNARDPDSAFEYLKEELAVILAMSDEYEFHVYAGQASPAISKLYSLFKDKFHLPMYVHANVSKEKNEHSLVLPVYLRLVVQQVAGMLSSGEIPLALRIEMASQLTDLIDSSALPQTFNKSSQQRLFSPQQSTADDKTTEEQQVDADVASSNTPTLYKE